MLAGAAAWIAAAGARSIAQLEQDDIDGAILKARPPPRPGDAPGRAGLVCLFVCLRCHAQCALAQTSSRARSTLEYPIEYPVWRRARREPCAAEDSGEGPQARARGRRARMLPTTALHSCVGSAQAAQRHCLQCAGDRRRRRRRRQPRWKRRRWKRRRCCPAGAPRRAWRAEPIGRVRIRSSSGGVVRRRSARASDGATASPLPPQALRPASRVL